MSSPARRESGSASSFICFIHLCRWDAMKHQDKNAANYLVGKKIEEAALDLLHILAWYFINTKLNIQSKEWGQNSQLRWPAELPGLSSSRDQMDTFNRKVWVKVMVCQRNRNWEVPISLENPCRHSTHSRWFLLFGGPLGDSAQVKGGMMPKMRKTTSNYMTKWWSFPWWF